MKTCDTCGSDRPNGKFNPESFSPNTCFSCRIGGIRLGFVAGKKAFHGDDLVGGTIASDNRHTVETARANGHDPVPMERGVSPVPASAIAKASEVAKSKKVKAAL